VLGLLLDCYQEQQDMWSFQVACQKFLALDATDADLWLAWAGAAVGNDQLTTAHHACDHFVNHWPDHPNAHEARETREQLGEVLLVEIAKFGLPQERGMELLRLHEEVNLQLHQGNFERVCQLAEDLLRQCPNFTPVLNNRSLAHFLLGRLDQAIADARNVLEFDADNFHALSNLTRSLFLNGRFDEAHEVAERLKRARSGSPDLYTKQAEALAFLGDWPGILETVQRAEARRAADPLDNFGLLFHLAGVAAAELGQLDVARKHWKRAVKLKSCADWAQQNLDDLNLPIGERNGPWAFPLDSWISPAVIERLAVDMRRAGPKAKDSAVRRRVRKLFEQFAHLEHLAPSLLERGDPNAKEFVIRVASLTGLPSIMSALREFVFGQRGSDQLRHEAGLRLVEASLLPSGKQKLWVDGEWRDLILMGFEITGEPTVELPPKLKKLATEGYEAIYEGDGPTAELLFKRVLAERPDDSSMLYNLANAIAIQGREEEALAQVRDIHKRFPDYTFARTRLAQDAAARRDFDAARALLDPLMTRTRFHVSEYAALCMAHIELLMAEGKKDGARSWLKIWRDADPDDPKLMIYEERLNRRGLLGKFFSPSDL
jgi:tetratricopeptide (TPR) repeat protein